MSLFVAPVPVSAPGLQSALTRLESIAREEAGRGNAVEITEAPRDAVTDRGRFVTSLPCLTTETVASGCRQGQIPVREPAGLHFCPSGYASGLAVFAGCPRYSSGAYRFGRAVYKVATADRRNPRSVP